jgi:hypothetical protein
MFGQKHSEETRKKIAAKLGKEVIVTNINTNEAVEYVSISEAAKGLNASKTTILRYMERQALYLGIYKIILKTLTVHELNPQFVSGFADGESRFSRGWCY